MASFSPVTSTLSDNYDKELFNTFREALKPADRLPLQTITAITVPNPETGIGTKQTSIFANSLLKQIPFTTNSVMYRIESKPLRERIRNIQKMEPGDLKKVFTEIANSIISREPYLFILMDSSLKPQRSINNPLVIMRVWDDLKEANLLPEKFSDFKILCQGRSPIIQMECLEGKHSLTNATKLFTEAKKIIVDEINAVIDKVRSWDNNLIKTANEYNLGSFIETMRGEIEPITSEIIKLRDTKPPITYAALRSIIHETCLSVPSEERPFQFVMLKIIILSIEKFMPIEKSIIEKSIDDELYLELEKCSDIVQRAILMSIQTIVKTTS